jgi:hypothetical protein
MKLEAIMIDLDDVLVDGNKRYRIIGRYLNSGGLGDSVRFKLYNLKTQKERLSFFFAHDCLLEVERESVGS